MANNLIAYFSWSGNIRRVAQRIQGLAGGDLFEITLLKPYSLDPNDALDEATRDLRIQARPALDKNVEDLGQYGNIFLGFPNWWGSIPMPIASFLAVGDFSFKKIFPFCSHGGGGVADSLKAIAKLAPVATIGEALSIQGDGGENLSHPISLWLDKIKVKKI
jgi:flavodoxin